MKTPPVVLSGADERVDGFDQDSQDAVMYRQCERAYIDGESFPTQLETASQLFSSMYGLNDDTDLISRSSSQVARTKGFMGLTRTVGILW